RFYGLPTSAPPTGWPPARVDAVLSTGSRNPTVPVTQDGVRRHTDARLTSGDSNTRSSAPTRDPMKERGLAPTGPASNARGVNVHFDEGGPCGRRIQRAAGRGDRSAPPAQRAGADGRRHRAAVGDGAYRQRPDRTSQRDREGR